MKPTDYPWIEDAFLRALDRDIAPIRVTPDTTMQQIMFNAGQRDIVTKLHYLAKLQRDNQQKK